MQKNRSANNVVKYSISLEACHWHPWWPTFPLWYFVFCIQQHILPNENILDIPLIKLIYHIMISLITTKVFPFIILIQLFCWLMRKNLMFQLLCLTHFWPMFHLCRNQEVGFYLQNVWKTYLEEWHFARNKKQKRKTQVPKRKKIGPWWRRKHKRPNKHCPGGWQQHFWIVATLVNKQSLIYHLKMF